MEMRQIPNFPGYYVTDDGRILSRRRGKKKWLTSFVYGGSYRGVNLSRDGVVVQKLVHRLVLEAFVGRCPEGMETRHLNGNPIDNRLENLCWGTSLENHIDSVRHGTCSGLRRGELHPTSKLTERQVLEIDRLYKTGKYLQRELGELFNIGSMTIHRIVKHRTWRYLWND